MSDLTGALFAPYNRVMRCSFAGVLLIACALVYLQFERTFNEETSALTQRMQEQALALDAIMKGSTDAVNALRIHAEDWYRLHPSVQPASPLLQSLRPCPTNGRVCLDHPPSPWTIRDIGNLTGFIDSSTPAVTSELEMALSLTDTFRVIKANLPEATWVYYTSVQRFIYIYPWVVSKEFFYADSLKQKDFFRSVEPDRNYARRIIWTPAYVDEAGQGGMVTASAGIFTDDQFRGAVSLDITLARLNEFVRSWQSDFGTLFIVNDHDQLLAHPSLGQKDVRNTLQLASVVSPALAKELTTTLRTSQGRFRRTHGYYIETLEIKNAPFRLVLIVPQWELFRSSLQSGVLAVLLLVAVLTVMLIGANRLIYREAVLPAQQLVRYIHEESKGAVKALPTVPAAWQPWFDTIQNVFNAHARLVSIEQELDVARRMQQSIVPKRFPTRADFQMFARMIPAKEVGGDFYDYFWLSNTRIGMVIADVSGKGVPAALFMAVARTLLRAIAPASGGPGESLTLANDLLGQDNDDAMFVTLFYGILDTRSGDFVYANGGHNRPYVLTSDGTITQLPGTGGMALGVVEKISYDEHRTKLAPGSTLLLYTDGITEAFNQDNEAYGERRLAELLAHDVRLTVEPLIQRLVDNVNGFANGAPQSDDITCLAIHYTGAGSDLVERIPRELDTSLSPYSPDISLLVDRLQSFFDDHSLSDALWQRFALAFDEVISNISAHGHPQHLIEVRVCVTDGEVCALVTDDGVAFNPLLVPDPETTSGIDERAIGGLGVFLLKKVMDRVTYEHRGGCNHLRFACHITQQPPGGAAGLDQTSDQ